MKKLLVIAMLMLSVGCMHAQVTREGNTFRKENTTAARDTLVTKYTWEDGKGNTYPIIVVKNSGRCYIWKTSGKTGKKYRQYLGEEVSREICRELGIAYVEKPKKK